MMMMVMKVKGQNINLLVDPEFLQLVHYGIDSVKVLRAPAVSVSVRPGNGCTDHTLRKRTRDAGDAQPLPLLLVHQDVIHYRETEC